jgi:N-ethylmaleimide reductase
MAKNRDMKLFSPVWIGPITLQHRVVMAPLTRSWSEQPGDIPENAAAALPASPVPRP